MSQRSFTSLTACALAGSALLPACLLEQPDGADEYREVLPRREAVVVAGPQADSAPDSGTASLAGTRRFQAAAPPGSGPYARWYGFTRVVRAGVNGVTAAVLGSAWAIAHSEPTAVRDGEAVWGPHTDALEPVTYRFRVLRVADAEYDYLLEGRPRASGADSDYRPVLRGHGYGKRHELHGEGEFAIDLDVARELDPFAHREDSGSVHVAYHLPRDAGDGNYLPRTIEAQVVPDPQSNPEHFSVTSRADRDGGGSLNVVASADLDETKTTELEDITVDSRFRADGAGRADIVIAAGDVPADPGKVSAVECWGADFVRSYYADSVEFEASEGDASACVFEAP